MVAPRHAHTLLVTLQDQFLQRMVPSLLAPIAHIQNYEFSIFGRKQREFKKK